MVDPNNDVARRLTPQQAERYETLRRMTPDQMRAHLLSAPPSAAAAYALYQLERISGYRAALDSLTSRVPSNGVDTSDAAAESVLKRLTPLRGRVLAAVAELGTATSDDVEALTGMSHQTVSTRMMELRRGLLIERCGKRKTRAGNPAHAHRLTEDGVERLREWAP